MLNWDPGLTVWGVIQGRGIFWHTPGNSKVQLGLTCTAEVQGPPAVLDCTEINIRCQWQCVRSQAKSRGSEDPVPLKLILLHTEGKVIPVHFMSAFFLFPFSLAYEPGRAQSRADTKGISEDVLGGGVGMSGVPSGINRRRGVLSMVWTQFSWWGRLTVWGWTGSMLSSCEGPFPCGGLCPSWTLIR